MAFLSQTDKNSGCYGNLQLPLTYNGGKWKMAFHDLLLSHCRYFDKSFIETFLVSSPLSNIPFLSKHLNLICCHGNQNAKFVKKYSKILSEAIRRIKLKLCRNVHNIRPTIKNCWFAVYRQTHHTPFCPLPDSFWPFEKKKSICNSFA